MYISDHPRSEYLMDTYEASFAIILFRSAKTIALFRQIVYSTRRMKQKYCFLNDKIRSPDCR